MDCRIKKPINRKKDVDFWRTIWYSKQAVRAGNRPRDTEDQEAEKKCWQAAQDMISCKSCWWERKAEENFEKTWKKYLTSDEAFAILAMFRRERCVPCKLNNVTKRKHQTVSSDVRNHKRAPESCWSTQ